MSLPIRNSRLLSHLAAMASAVALSLGLYWGADGALSALVHPHSSVASVRDNYLPNLGPDWGTQNVNLNRLGNALADGTLVVLGSSELSSHDLRFVPYRFFPQELKVPTLAYGHAMFQSYGIVSVLEAVADSLTPNTRLVIMVSPAWFASGGQLPRSAFAEHVTGPVWDRLWDKPATREQMQDWIADNANWGLLWLIANGQVAELKDKIALWWNSRGERAPDRPRSPLAVPAHKYVSWPAAARLDAGRWHDLLGQARGIEAELGGHNPYDVRDDYYRQYLAPLNSPARNEFPEMPPMTRPELGDLARVMALLQQRKVRAYFVIQPFNPKLILDVERFDPVADAIKGMCARYGMGCLDMYSVPFQSGMVRDDMHLAELGWAIADQGIAEFFSR
ncbi:DltD C-terminal domain protein [Bordetella bronchiseptica E014]|nr:DltD C-terminal domain protein [Bordetella bronchiseptica CA90 BB02]KCV30232.1 DltD C-terminal domain protein [Bordetella bronchiseptica 00-P-2730]KCV55344.1 DltD C-terminal domain protein [Bordetella bronchiseptica 7E71]KDC13893.1 DltD C-terminal domain protein [Bordetella bronchiseptica E014]KDC33200.1 DltD C-terminal domain protein [Bordetella bronchiseptica F4563]KDC93589.1 DltD C-terminal domain protein [Bordetella bronchiseptica MBORD675]KDD16435.1 DltD C-terminal domain protein [Bor